MRNKYYADNRDLVKWGVLLYLAREFDISRILQVAYLRDTMWGQLEVDGIVVPIPEPVLAHFRNVGNIAGLVEAPRIDVLDAPFANRDQYMRLVLDAISDRSDGHACIVFLDPDTGLQPTHPGSKHVLDTELRGIWNTMRSGDLIVVYQHQTNRSGQPWVEPKRWQFEAALGLPSGGVKVAHGRSIARDVVFFYCER